MAALSHTSIYVLMIQCTNLIIIKLFIELQKRKLVNIKFKLLISVMLVCTKQVNCCFQII